MVSNHVNGCHRCIRTTQKLPQSETVTVGFLNLCHDGGWKQGKDQETPRLCLRYNACSEISVSSAIKTTAVVAIRETFPDRGHPGILHQCYRGKHPFYMLGMPVFVADRHESPLAHPTIPGKTGYHVRNPCSYTTVLHDSLLRTMNSRVNRYDRNTTLGYIYIYLSLIHI